MRPTLAVLSLGLMTCGRLVPVDEPGAGSISGCLVNDALVPVVSAHVFATRDASVLREVRSAQDGCFFIDSVDSGRIMLVVNDFHGYGLTEPVRVYAAQQTRLGRRVIQSLAANTALPTLRGIGFVETLASGAISWCAPNHLVVAASPQTAQVNYNGERQPGLIETTWEADRIHSIHRTATGEEVSPAPGEDCWSSVVIGHEIALVRGGSAREGSYCSTRGGPWRVLTSSPGETEVPGNSAWLTDDGLAARILENQWHKVVLHEVGPMGHVSSTLVTATDEEWPELIVGDFVSPRFAALFRVRGATTSSYMIVQPDAPPIYLQLPADRAVIAWSSRRAISWLTYTEVDQRVVTTADDVWAIFDTSSRELKQLPAPVIGTNRRYADSLPLRVFDDRTAQLIVYSRDGLTGTVIEHDGETIRERSLALPPLSRPVFEGGAHQTVLNFTPALSLFRMPDLQLEILRVGDEVGLKLLRLGAPLETAVRLPTPTFAFSPWPVCARGGELYLNGASLDSRSTIFKYDIAKIADELLPPR